ncbi:undecaprenyl-diphosphate phosphatase [Nocardia stercoris]|uniref:Undecaprenyl-diphosphatase n=1 Tax=Nocardia stercoris TaxID=2483361 RepID=A0A3M2LIJ4_9NOCA|nr:undecaprenyl-diphosphate phosphatase [Nocardia stercoris]RMI35835.1 undecaprenyl-diphosphate phosphatase [Nocardia stercoris]
MLTYFQAVVIGALQGVTELFPISSLGHSVLLPAWLGGSWKELVTESDSSSGTPYLAFIVALHVATAIALLGHYWKDWRDIIIGFFQTVVTRRVETDTQRLAWLIIIATVPVGLIGLLLEHTLRSMFAKPSFSAVFLFLNGFVLLIGEGLRRRNAPTLADYGRKFAEQERARELGYGEDPYGTVATEERLATLSVKDALGIGLAQCGALLSGFSRSGLTMIGGLLRGLDHEDTAKFAFLLATPVIFAAGVLKLPELFKPEASGIHGQILVGSVVAGVAAWLSVRFLERFFKTRTLVPFAVYCLAAGFFSILRFVVF